MCRGLSCANVEEVVRIVLKELVGIEPERLPQATFAKYMLLEVGALAQIHVATKLVEGEPEACNTLHSDGTSKKKRGITTYDVCDKCGDSLVVGLHQVALGDAESQLSLFKEILTDVFEMGEVENTPQAVKNAIVSIKNLMSDRCATQKKFNELFIQFCKSLLPELLNNRENLSLDEQNRLANLNEFFCRLHFIVGLADQAKVCLKVWESMCFGESKVGSLAHGGYSNGESGITRLVRTVCKSVQEKGCEKSGRMETFATVMHETHGISNIPSYPFLGNRFNILFLNGAGVFFLYPYFNFFDELDKENKLLTAVGHDLNVVNYRAGCRALGLIDKLVSGPLWRKMVLEKYALNMTAHYKHMLSCFKLWAENSDPVLSGSVSLFPDHVKKDARYEKFISRDETDEMTKQCLEIIFAGFIVVSTRMLEDHLEGGKLNENVETLEIEASKVAATNADPERDFGMLDRYMRNKTKGLYLVNEGLIMFIKNGTGDWRNSLSKEQLKKVIKIARKSVPKQKNLYFKLKDEIRKAIMQKDK